jgi:hypothetical protein
MPPNNNDKIEKKLLVRRTFAVKKTRRVRLSIASEETQV